MGYTHYWEQKKWTKKDREGFKKALPIIKDIVLKRHQNLVQFEDDDNKLPVVSEDLIRFNGIGPEGHETLYIENKETGFAFCKTARKLYDQAVCEVILTLNALCRNFKISSDGFSGYLENPELDESFPAAIEALKSNYGIHYHMEVVEEREPYCDMRPVLDKVEELTSV